MKQENGIFKITPKNPLGSGEYAFLQMNITAGAGAGAWQPNQLYDFGVDGISGGQSTQKISKSSEEAGN